MDLFCSVFVFAAILLSFRYDVEPKYCVGIVQVCRAKVQVVPAKMMFIILELSLQVNWLWCERKPFHRRIL